VLSNPLSIADVVKLFCVGAVCLALGTAAGTWHGKGLGRAEAAAEAAKLALERVQELEKNNANFKNLSDRDRCLVFMRDSGLPENNCD
jgi:hypothetical protein